MDIYSESVEKHRQLQGKITITPKENIVNTKDLSLVYSPGVARPAQMIAKDPHLSFDLTWRGNAIAVVTDGSAVLGLGDIGPAAALPVMEGKAMLFSQLAGLDAVPICLSAQDSSEIIQIVRALAPSFGGINLEDIAAPRCFEIEEALQDLGIPVFHDDQHGTAIVVLAGIINALRVVNKKIEDCRILVNGAGAAGLAITQFLLDYSMPPKDIIVCDSHGVIVAGRGDLNSEKEKIATKTNKDQVSGTIHDAIARTDIFIGVSKGGLLTKDDIAKMNTQAIVFALANPDPEILPDEAKAGGVAVVATGRSDFPNQVNNVLAFPGIFRGALDIRAPRITLAMKYAAAQAIADLITNPTADRILPDPLDPAVVPAVATAVENTQFPA